MTTPRVVVPVDDSATVRNTVADAVRSLHERRDGGPAEVHLVYPLSRRLLENEEAVEGRELLERAATWAEEDLGEDTAIAVETAMIGIDEYLFSPGDYARVILEYARTNGIEEVVLDPGYTPAGTTPLLPPLSAELRRAGIDVREAPVTRERRGPRLVRRGTAEQFVELFGVSFLFYLVLAGTVDPFEVATGTVAAGVVAVALWHVSFRGPARPRRTGRQLLRLLVYVPYLLWEITKANLQIAYVVLHPGLPIDPELVEFDAVVWSPISVTTLANSITLTPGTLTVDVTRWHFTVHTLTEPSRRSLLAGGLERAVRFVFYGRAASRIPSPAERREESGGEP